MTDHILSAEHELELCRRSQGRSDSLQIAQAHALIAIAEQLRDLNSQTEE